MSTARCHTVATASPHFSLVLITVFQKLRSFSLCSNSLPINPLRSNSKILTKEKFVTTPPQLKAYEQNVRSKVRLVVRKLAPLPYNPFQICRASISRRATVPNRASWTGEPAATYLPTGLFKDLQDRETLLNVKWSMPTSALASLGPH